LKHLGGGRGAGGRIPKKSKNPKNNNSRSGIFCKKLIFLKKEEEIRHKIFPFN
jgi:hypothetical protein